MKTFRSFKLLTILTLCLLLPAPALGSGVFTGIKIGTLGIGADLGYQFSELFKVRFNANYLPFDRSGKLDDIKYDIEVKSPSFGALMDLHPFRGKFRLSAGIYYRDFDMDLSARPGKNTDIDLGDYSFSASELGELKGNVTFDKWAPYLGLGWGMGGGTSSNFSIDFDLGAMYLSGTEIKYWAEGPITQWENSGFLQQQQKYREYREGVDKEVENLEDIIDTVGVYPVINLGFSYRF